MNSADYVEMCGCECLLEKVKLGTVQAPNWGDSTQEKMKIVEEFLSYRSQELKEKQ